MDSAPEPVATTVSWPSALLPGLALFALLLGGAATQTAADDRPAGRTVVELELIGR